MKILFLSHYGRLFGANRSLLTLVEGVRAKGATVEVWCNEEGDFPTYLKANGIPCRLFPYHNWAATFLHPTFFMLPYSSFRNRQLLPSLIEEAKVFNPNIIHTNSSVLGIGAQLAAAMEKPHIWHLREFPWKQYRKVFFPSRKILNRHLAKAKKVITVSKALRSELGSGLDTNNWEVIYNGIVDQNTALPQLDATPKSPGDSFIFINVGILHPAKNQLEAIEAFAQIAKNHPNAQLHLVGMGQRRYERQLKRRVKKYGLENQIIFRGFVKDMDAIYRQADALIICSRDEGMGRVSVEAMMHGIPVIGYNGGATPELVRDGQNGLLYQHGPTDLAAKLTQLLKNPDLSKQYGKNGRQTALERFSQQQYVNRVFDLFREVFPF